MSPHNDSEPLLSEAEVMKIIEEAGGPAAINEGLREFRQMVDRLWREKPSLLHKYPDKWVAMGLDGVVAVGDSMDAVLEEAENRGLRKKVVVEFMDTDPPELIL